MKKIFLKCVTAMLWLAMLIGSIPFGVAAEASEISDEAPRVQSQTVGEKSGVSTIISEIPNLRNEYEKHFLMSDGSYTVATFNEPVHKNVDGCWVEVDNTLKLSTKADGHSRYETVDGITDLSFAQEFGDELVTMEQDGYSVTWSLKAVTTGGEKLAATEQTSFSPASATLVADHVRNVGAEEQKTMAMKSTSALRYANALSDGVDVSYVVLPSRVKESIILNSPKDISAYVLDISVENLSARLLKNREIEFFNESGEVIFTMWAPYMYDAAGELSEDIDVEIVSEKDGGYLVSISPDNQWLTNSNRVYPVVIDPDVSASRVRTNIIDNYVLEGSGNQNCNLDRMYIGLKSGHIARAYLRYEELPTISSNAEITNAVQTLFILANTSTANTANAYRVTGGTWTSSEITWANKPAASVAVATNISHNGRTKYSFNCTSAVKHWYTNNTSGTYQNYGFMIRYADETINDYNSFYSADYSVESKRPMLTISYKISIPPTDDDIAWPVPSCHTITSPFGYRESTASFHRGIDIGCYQAPVVAAISGEVYCFRDSSAGTAMEVRQSSSTFRTRYFHLLYESRLYDTGDYVEVGTTIAVSGNTGNSTGPHLHFQLQWGDDKNKLYNPLEFYHRSDKRYGKTNPNPMFILIDGKFVPNDNFNYTYTPSYYNEVYLPT